MTKTTNHIVHQITKLLISATEEIILREYAEIHLHSNQIQTQIEKPTSFSIWLQIPRLSTRKAHLIPMNTVGLVYWISMTTIYYMYTIV